MTLNARGIAVNEHTAGPVAPTWETVLAHRTDPAAAELALARFVSQGVPVELVAASLEDKGAALFREAASGRSDWAAPIGGLVSAALLAGEVAIYCSTLVSRASAIRSVAVDALLEDLSAVAVAAELGVSRQKVYEIARGGAKLREHAAREHL
jgi:hypothetical protein